MTQPYKLAYLVSHPIQYQAPLLRAIAQRPDIDLTTYFLSDFSLRGYEDIGFGTTVKWDVPLLEGYKHVFLSAWGGTDRVTAIRPWTKGLGQHLVSGGYDALWLHGYAHPVNLRAMLIAKRLGMKVFLRTDTHTGSAEGVGIKRKIKEAILRRLFAMADGCLAVGSLNRQYYRQYGVPDDKNFLMPYAVDNAFFQAHANAAASQKEELRAELGLTPGRSIILYASRFITRKRIQDIITAYSQLSPDGTQEPLPYLLLIGDGSERAALETQAKSLGWNSIRFLGFKNQTELPAFFNLCDVFVLVPEREPWALVVNEVMNAGKAIILSDQVGAAADLVREGENGYVIPTGNVSALAKRLQELLSQPELIVSMGRRSLEIINDWGLQENIDALLMALQKTVGTPRYSSEQGVSSSFPENVL